MADRSDGASEAGFCPGCGIRIWSLWGFCPRCGRNLADLHLAVSGAAGREVPEEASGSPHVGEALRLLRAGLADEAAARLRASLAETPGDIEARLILAQAQFERGAITEAGALLDEAANLGPDRFDVRLRRGEFFARLGIYQRAFAELDAARRLPVPDFASLLYCEELRRWVAERARLAVLREPALPPAPRWLRSLAHRVWPWHRQPEGQLR